MNNSLNICHQTNKETTSKQTSMASKFEVKIKLDFCSNKIDVQYHWITASKKNHMISQSILQLIMIHFFHTQSTPNQTEGVCVTGLTEFSSNGMTFRAHPNYKNDTPWFDWVLIAWNISDNNKSSRNMEDSPDYVELPEMNNGAEIINDKAMLIPAKLICIIEDQSKNIFATIHSCL
jgi:hypothetical protein